MLIIDDDVELCELLIDYLTSAGIEVDAVNESDEGVRKALSGKYAAAVLDVMLPGIDGFEVLRRIRGKSNLPVLMLTARGEEVDRIVGLEIGADDYLPKPFNPRELVARLRAILRRTQSTSTMFASARDRRISAGDIQLDPGARTAECASQAIELTSAEFDLLEALMRSAGHVVSRDELSQTVFGRKLFPEDRSIDVHISNLRRKLARQCGGGERIKTLRGSGYIFALSSPTNGAVANAQHSQSAET